MMIKTVLRGLTIVVSYLLSFILKGLLWEMLGGCWEKCPVPGDVAQTAYVSIPVRIASNGSMLYFPWITLFNLLGSPTKRQISLGLDRSAVE